MIIEVQSQQKTILFNTSRFIRIIRRILLRLNIQRCELSIVLTTDQKIRALNRKYLKRDRATDVLAFDLIPQGLSLKGKGRSRALAGEVIVSTDMARRNAKIYGVAVVDEVMLYVIHGILHLRGYDDHAVPEVRRMRQKEQELLKTIRPALTGIVTR